MGIFVTLPMSRTREILYQLVSFDTTSRDPNRALIDHVHGILAEFGVESTVLPDETGEKANLVATIGPDTDGGIVISGHTDCVPVDGQDWSSDPFDMIEHDGRLYGRGTCDMKGFVALALAMAPEFGKRPLKRPIHIAHTHDEETTFAGARRLADGLAGHFPGANAVIVGEPTMMEIVDAHKGCVTLETEITGHEAHSCNVHHGANAVFAGGKIMAEIERLRAEMIALGDPSGRFDPPYTSVHVGTFNGGTARNIVPLKARIGWEIRPLPGQDTGPLIERIRDFAQKKVLPAMKEVSPDCEITTTIGLEAFGLKPEPGSIAETIAMRCAGRNATHAVSYGTEAGLFQGAGVSTIICGPGSIDQAHQPDEFVDLDQLAAAEALHRLADVACEG